MKANNNNDWLSIATSDTITKLSSIQEKTIEKQKKIKNVVLITIFYIFISLMGYCLLWYNTNFYITAAIWLVVYSNNIGVKLIKLMDELKK